MGRLFGTDGVRGLANRDLTPESTVLLAASAADAIIEAHGSLSSGASGSQRPFAVVARDPRASGEFLEAAVVAGLASAGVDVLRAGILPTPALAFLTADLGADLGVMLSASHNPMPDNGIKIFAAGGHKLPDELEDRIEAGMADLGERPIGAAVGRVRDLVDAGDRYVAHLLSAYPGPLAGLRVVVDCANGAASVVSPEALRSAGADVVAIHCAPDGLNINDGCGSTHMDDLRAAVLETGAHVGIAHDGDADRCLAVDERGELVDGDQILAILAVDRRERGELREDTIVATVMSNLGFRMAMAERGIEVVETAVGDRYVLAEMMAGGYRLGGEQSGHIIDLDHATTGDGVLTALALLSRCASSGQPLSALAGVMRRLPQVLVNVAGVDRSRLARAESVADVVAQVEAELGSTGRVLLRPSGTEPLIRVMVEAADADTAQDCAERIAHEVRSSLVLEG